MMAPDEVIHDGPLSAAERAALFKAAAARAGWDDPAMDVYNDLDPRTESCESPSPA